MTQRGHGCHQSPPLDRTSAHRGLRDVLMCPEPEQSCPMCGIISSLGVRGELKIHILSALLLPELFDFLYQPHAWSASSPAHRAQCCFIPLLLLQQGAPRDVQSCAFCVLGAQSKNTHARKAPCANFKVNNLFPMMFFSKMALQD